MDRWNLSSLIENEGSPSEATIVGLLRGHTDELPRGVSPAYLARAILAELPAESTVTTAGNEPPLSDSDIEELSAIPKGAKHASLYQRKVFRILAMVFDGDLVAGSMEARQNSGRKRIDILFRNNASAGFFFDIVQKHQIKCPYVPVECKNYTDDLKNPEFDQLAGRLNRKVGMFGMITCRSNSDKESIAARALDLAHKEDKFVLVLEDCDLAQLVKLKLAGDVKGVHQFMHEQLHPRILD